MRHRLLFIPAAIAAAVAVFWILGGGTVDTSVLTRMLGLAPGADQRAASTKPICSQVIVPVGDCIPQHLADLPPDPGPYGMKTRDGVDSNQDGTRDEVEILIRTTWAESERAVRSLTMFAQNAQRLVTLGGAIDPDNAYEHAKEFDRLVTCYMRSTDEKLRQVAAPRIVLHAVLNTPERADHFTKAIQQASQRRYVIPDDPLPKLCGYDPATLPN